MLSRVMLLCLFCSYAWAKPAIQAGNQPVNPGHIPQGSASEVGVRLASGNNEQIALMPGGPFIRQTLPLAGNDIALHQGTALLAADGLLLVDARAGGQMKLLGRYQTPGKVLRVRAEAGKAWLATEQNELVGLDISKPAKPVELGRYSTGQTVTDFVLQDGYAYLLLGGNSIVVLDTRVPQQPVEISRIKLDGVAKKIAVANGRIYAAQPAYGLTIIDAHDQAHLALAGKHALNGGVAELSVQDDIALVARGVNGITLLDVADPAHVRWLGSHSRVGHVEGIARKGQKIVLWNDRAEVISLDIGKPNLPVIAAAQQGISAQSALWLDDNTVLALSAAGLHSIDFAATPVPFSNENLDSGQGVNFGGERRLFIGGDIAYVADWFSGLHLYDISNPAHPRLLSSFHTPGSAKGVVVRNGYAFVADDDRGLQIVDVHDPFHPSHVAKLDTRGLAYTPKLAGNLLYLASHRGGFQIIDVSDPRQPKMLADIDTPGKAWSLEATGSTLYVADDAAGVLVYDVSDVQHPRRIGVFNPGGTAEDVVVRGDTAYAAFFDGGFYVLDISRPAQPRQIGHVATRGNARVIELKDNLAFVTDWFAGVQVIDIGDRTAPVLSGEYDTSGAAWGIAIKGNYAYVGDWWGGFATLNIRNPNKPVLADRYQLRGAVTQVEAQGKFAYAAIENGGVQLFEMTNPLNPTWITGIEIDGSITALALEDMLLYAAVGEGRDSGVVIIDISDPFQARRIEHIALKGGAQRIRVAAGRIYVGTARGLSELVRGRAAPAKPQYAAKINDFWVADQRIYLATEQGMTVLDGQFNVLLQYTAAAARLVRAAGSTIFLYGAETGLSILQLNDNQLSPLSSFASTMRWADIGIAGQVLYATGQDAEMWAIDIADLRNPRLQTVYPLTRAAGSIKAINGTVLLSGNDILTALKPLPAVAVTRRAKAEIRLQLPATLPAGTYHLLSVAPDGKRSLHHNALNIEMPHFSKPDITPEEFKLLLQEQLKKNAQ